jgi:hypothetical protein
LKCEKCGYISFDYNLNCPSCKKDLSTVRAKLGIALVAPAITMDEFFTGGSGGFRSIPATQPITKEPELDIDSVGEEFEFTLDD